MTPETLDRSIAAFREIFGPASRLAAPVATRGDVDLFAHTAALRNLNGCVTRFVDCDGRDVDPPAIFSDTLRRGERGVLTSDELRMLDEIRSGDYRVMAEPMRVTGGAPQRAARDRLPLEEELRVRRETLARINREAVPRRSSSKPRWWLGAESSGAGPVVTDTVDMSSTPTRETTGVVIRTRANKSVTIRIGRRAWEEIAGQARAHAGEVESGGGLYAPHRPSWERTLTVSDANEVAKDKRWGSAVIYRRDLDQDAAPGDGYHLVGSWHSHPEMCSEPSTGDVLMWRSELEEAHARHGHVRQVHLIVAESRDRGWSRPSVAAWSIRLEPWLTYEDRFVLEPAIVETP